MVEPVTFKGEAGTVVVELVASGKGSYRVASTFVPANGDQPRTNLGGWRLGLANGRRDFDAWVAYQQKSRHFDLAS